MLDDDGPVEEPRAEIIEVTNQPIPWSPAAPARPAEGRAQAAAGARLGGRRAATAIAGLVAILTLAIIAGQANLFTAPVPEVLPSPLPSSIFPAQVAGLSVIGVDAANAQDVAGSTASNELAVGGWYTARETLAVCHEAYVPCGELWTTRLLSSATPLFASDGSSLPQAAGMAALQTVFVTPVRKPDLPVRNPLGVHPTIDPTALVLVGHFHDDRAGECTTNSPQALACGPAFVVDAVADLAGVVRTSGATATGLEPALSAADVVTRIRGQVRPGGVVLEFGPVIWFADGVNFSPVELDPNGPPVDSRYVWLVRGYLASAPSWLAIDDTTGQTWGPLAQVAAANQLARGIPPTIDGLTVRSVGLAVRANPGCCQLVAIGGFLSNDRAPEGCPPETTSGKPNPCGDTQLALVDQPGSILLPNDQTFLYDLTIPPYMPSIQPVFVPGTTVPDPWAGLSGLAARTAPRAVILIGQFGDPRSPECAARPGGGNAGCDHSFVVDQVAWLDGTVEGPSISMEPGVAVSHTTGEIAVLVPVDQMVGASITIVSIVATSRASAQSLGGVAIRGQGAGAFWIVRFISIAEGGAEQSESVVFDDRTLALVGTGL